MANSIAMPYKEGTHQGGGAIRREGMYRRAETGIMGVGRAEAIADCIEFIKRSASSSSETESASDSAPAPASDSV